MLFKDYHIPMIRSGSKTVTRREWDENYHGPNVGTVVAAKTDLLKPDDKCDCFIRITGKREEYLGEITEASARREGDYDGVEEFRDGYEEVYGEGSWDADKVVNVVEFEYVGESRPGDDGSEQTKLVTDGGEEVTDGTYHVGDAVDVLADLQAESAAVVHLDDAWARPGRQGAFGVEYPTHGFETTTEVVAACWRVLEPGGWLIADADDWLAPRLEAHIRDEYGDVTAYGDYQGGGYRRRGAVTYVDASGTPDESTAGQYLSNGGYPVIFAHKGDTDRRATASARQLARQPRRVEPGYPYGRGSVKPVGPYRKWVEALTERGELVVEPCAGTAPAAIAAEELGRRWVAADLEKDARRAFRERRAALLDSQPTLTEAVSDD